MATIPIVVGAIGAQAWAAIAAGQAVGVIGSIFIQLGWGVTGPAEIAATPDAAKRTYIYRESLYYRFAVTLPVIIVISAISWHVVPAQYSLISAIAGAGSAMLGLTASWYFVGKGAPISLLRLDTLPRVLSVIVGSALLLVYPDAIIFAVAVLFSSVLPLLMASMAIRRESRELGEDSKVDFSWSRGKEILSYQAPGIVSSVISQSYKFLPLILISAIRPDHAAAYALIDRIIKFAIAAIKPVAQSLQAWVPGAGTDRVIPRIWVAMSIAGCAGGVAGCSFLVVGPMVANFLGAEAIELSYGFYLPAALVLSSSALTQMGMLSLLALGRRTSLATSVAFGGFAGLAVLYPAVKQLGALGGLYCLLFAELVVLAVQLSILHHSFRNARQLGLGANPVTRLSNR